jgi:transposase
MLMGKRLHNKEFQQMVPLLREKGFYEHQEQRKIEWPEYNLSQIENAKTTLEFIRDEVDKAEYLDTTGKEGKPLTDPKDLAKAILVCEALGLTEREAEGWLDILGSFLGIYQHLDDRTIGDGYDKVEVLHILKQIFDNTKSSDGNLAGDGTGLERTRKQNYESENKYGEYMTNIVDSREIVQAFDITGTQECRIMYKLIDQVEGDKLTLDAGFNDRKLVEKIDKLGITPFVFPKKNNVLNGKLAWKQMYLELYLDVMQWLIEYHQRSHAESFYSSFKRKNQPIMKRRPTCILNQVTARIILHNRRKLAYFNKLADAS